MATRPQAFDMPQRGLDSMVLDDGAGPTPPAPENVRQSNSLGGILQVRSVQDVLQAERDAARLVAQEANTAPVLQALAQHIHDCWSDARSARSDVTEMMVEAARSAEGRYAPDMESSLRRQNDSLIYIMLFAAKKRAMVALLKDVLAGTGVDKPWGLSPTPMPDLPPDLQEALFQQTFEVAAQAELTGQPMSVPDIAQMLRDARDRAENTLNHEARTRVAREERLMEDMLEEGGFQEAFEAFLDDLAVYPTAFMKGPVVRNVGQLTWVQAEDGGFVPEVVRDLRPQWERVDPMRLYPSRGARTVQDGYLVEVHDLNISDLDSLRGVEGYSSAAIDAVIKDNTNGALMSHWATLPWNRDGGERPHEQRVAQTVEALQFWGRVPGAMLVEWGMEAADVPDPADSYEIEAWVIDSWVIKAVINTDPLQTRPYFGCSFDPVPGRVWGNAMYHALRDCQAMCNSSARALDVNMGLSSGPQVGVNIDRMPNGEDITQMHPWKIWQFNNSMSGDNSQPLYFFQPSSNAQELMAVFEKYSQLADEYTGIPRYMTGQTQGMGGASRTASGMSMMIGNASKTIKSLIGSIDVRMMAPLLQSLHVHIMRFYEDNTVKGDINIVPRGAQFLATKEAAQMRRNEFLQVTANPIDMEIVGVEGRAALLREVAKTLDMDTDQVVPPLTEIKARLAQQAAQQMMAQQAMMQAQGGMDQTQLDNGAPVTQNFDPMPA